jgi:hypothetical protein
LAYARQEGNIRDYDELILTELESENTVKSVWPIVALVVIGGCVWFLVSYYASQPKPGQVVPHRAPVACNACGKAYITMLGDENQPAKCFFCGEQELWRGRQCVECKTVIPMVGGPDEWAATKPVCPKCGKSRFMEVSPDGLEEH